MNNVCSPVDYVDFIVDRMEFIVEYMDFIYKYTMYSIVVYADSVVECENCVFVCVDKLA